MTERILASGPLSRKCSFRLFVSGPVTAREINSLITFLKLHRKFLAEDKAEADRLERKRGDG